MKGLLVVLLDIASILALSIAAYQQRHCYAVGGEAVLICAILGQKNGWKSRSKRFGRPNMYFLFQSMACLVKNVQNPLPLRGRRTIL